MKKLSFMLVFLLEIEKTYYETTGSIFDEIVGNISGLYPWHGANFSRQDKYGDHVQVILSKEARDSGFWKTCKVTSDGKIEDVANSSDDSQYE